MIPIILAAIITIESAGDPKAHNLKTDARGVCQIRPVCLIEFNRLNKKHRVIRPQELFDREKNVVVADWYLNERIPSMLAAYEIDVTAENILIAYNWGIGNFHRHLKNGIGKIPADTIKYVKDYKALTE